MSKFRCGSPTTLRNQSWHVQERKRLKLYLLIAWRSNSLLEFAQNQQEFLKSLLAGGSREAIDLPPWGRNCFCRLSFPALDCGSRSSCIGLFRAFIHFQTHQCDLLSRVPHGHEGLWLKYRCSGFVEEAFERSLEAEFTFSAPSLYNTCVRGLVGRNRIHSRQWEEGLLKGRSATECGNWEWYSQKLLHGWTREFQDRGACLPVADTLHCRCPGDDTVSVPIYQSLPPLPAWPPLDWRKPASATCLLRSSKQSWNTACSSLSSASDLCTPSCLTSICPSASCSLSAGLLPFHLYFCPVISHSTKWASPSISALPSFINS